MQERLTFIFSNDIKIKDLKVKTSTWRLIMFQLGKRPSKARLIDEKARDRFSRNMKVIMASKGISGTGLARMIWLDQANVCRILKHPNSKKTTMSLEICQHISTALGVSVESMCTKDFGSAIEQAITELDKS